MANYNNQRRIGRNETEHLEENFRQQGHGDQETVAARDQCDAEAHNAEARFVASQTSASRSATGAATCHGCSGQINIDLALC
jgi:hypothetical protein